MKGITLNFTNRPNSDGTVSNFSIDDCLISSNGSPTTLRPQVIVHLPKTSTQNVNDAWFKWDGETYHIIGTTPKGIDENVPTRWNRYFIAEKLY